MFRTTEKTGFFPGRSVAPAGKSRVSSPPCRHWFSSMGLSQYAGFLKHEKLPQ
ncbi:Uncharacterized protein dnm_077210 [Desulfonema magnum]|uniref:Uncharacterized protein n=1 Tax=Desulfonema magnum TaxID=45655 RepID=A0A975GT16_9BACT|nr:Uncharacterized protein dnm_077210 [Desulfonema magnum]